MYAAPACWVDRLNDAVSILKAKPVNGHKMYDIIYMTFLGPDKLMHEELLYRLDISARHYYRLRTQAINIIALRLWSAPAGEVDSWLEVLSILETGKVKGLDYYIASTGAGQMIPRRCIDIAAV